jgi:hypothetical protein
MYDLGLAAGKSETDFRVCVYKVSDSQSQMERRKFWLERRKSAVLEGISQGLLGRTNLPAETLPAPFWIRLPDVPTSPRPQSSSSLRLVTPITLVEWGAPILGAQSLLSRLAPPLNGYLLLLSHNPK